MATTTATPPAASSGSARPAFDPNFPAAALVKSIREDAEAAQSKSLARIATLSIPVAGQTAKVANLDAAIQEVVAHGQTISLWGEMFSKFQAGTLGREELDQSLLNWALKIPALKEKFDELPDDVKAIVDKFRDADLDKLDEVKGLAQKFEFAPSPGTSAMMADLQTALDGQTEAAKASKYPSVVEQDGTPVEYVEKADFENWGQTVRNTPAVTFIPKSVVGVQNIVKYAKDKKKKVRCSGYRHSWSDLFSKDDEILISLLPLRTATHLPSFEGSWVPGKGLLQQIQVIPESEASDHSTICAKIGTATTNEQFRKWCLDPKGGNVMWTLPLNVIMVEITFGGSISPICHGAGIRHKTLSDLVVEVEYVDCNGNLHTVSDPEMLKSAAGAFGLLGVVTAYTLRLDKMTYTAMKPYQCPIEFAIPPPQEYIDAARKGNPKYKWIKDLTDQHSQADIDKALAEFIKRAENDYYAEWFWFPLQRNVWVNTWDNTGAQAQASEIPSYWGAFLQWIEEWIAELINNWIIWQALPGEQQAQLLGFVTLLQLPNLSESDPPLVTQLINGLHFRRGIQNMRVMDMEWEIEVPPLPPSGTAPKTGTQHKSVLQRLHLTSSKPTTQTTNGASSSAPAGTSAAAEPAATTPPKRDWLITQKAWWDAVLLMQSDPSKVRIALEMRIMGGSDIHLAPMRGYNLGTTSIEILTTPNTLPHDWIPFCQKLTDIWLNYTDRTTGNRVRARPHWCKQWTFLTMPDQRGKPMLARDWISKVGYKDEIPLFIDGLKKIGEIAGFTVDELKERFSNPLLEKCIFGVGSDVEPAPVPPTYLRRIIGAIKDLPQTIKGLFRSCFS